MRRRATGLARGASSSSAWIRLSEEPSLSYKPGTEPASAGGVLAVTRAGAIVWLAININSGAPCDALPPAL